MVTLTKGNRRAVISDDSRQVAYLRRSFLRFRLVDVTATSCTEDAYTVSRQWIEQGYRWQGCRIVAREV